MIKQISSNPDSYEQGTWMKDMTTKTMCGSEGCLGGWAAIFGKVYTLKSLLLASARGRFSIRKVAKKLGITEIEAHVLFSGYRAGWPKRFFEPFHYAITKKEKAKVAVQYLNYIIETGEVYQ